jgi:prepilin-type N-terminal cleavage/methylation domain-containing protein
MRTRGQTGFTLLELMIALSLTALLSLVAFTSLNLSLKTVSRGQAAAERLQEQRVGVTILKRSLTSAVLGTLANQTYFIGERRQMRFFTLAPLEAHNLGGVYHWRLLLGEDEAHHGVLAVEQTKNVNWYRDPEGVEIRQILLRDLTDLHFTYGTGKDEFETWDGKKVGNLPDWVKVHLTLKGQPPMELEIPIHVAEFKIK